MAGKKRGRKAYPEWKKKQTTSIRLDPEVINEMDDQKINRSNLINKLLRLHLALD